MGHQWITDITAASLPLVHPSMRPEASKGHALAKVNKLLPPTTTYRRKANFSGKRRTLIQATSFMKCIKGGKSLKQKVNPAYVQPFKRQTYAYFFSRKEMRVLLHYLGEHEIIIFVNKILYKLKKN